MISAGKAAMSEESDEEIQRLIDLSNGGDKQARERLIEFTANRLHKLSRTMLADFPAVQRWEQTDDVRQKATLELHKALQTVRLDSPRHFFSLAAQKIRWALIDLKRHYYGPQGIGTKHHTDHQPGDEAGGTLAEERWTPEDLDQWEALHEAVGNLPEDRREVFSLIHYHGLTLERVAGILGVHVSTVKRRWQEAKLQLHDDLADES